MLEMFKTGDYSTCSHLPRRLHHLRIILYQGDPPFECCSAAVLLILYVTSSSGLHPCTATRRFPVFDHSGHRIPVPNDIRGNAVMSAAIVLPISYQEGPVAELVKACVNMASKRRRLIVIGGAGPKFPEVGVEIDAKVSSDLITSIFCLFADPRQPGDPAGRLKQAGCFLPCRRTLISASPRYPAPRGPGLTERGCSTIVVSERPAFGCCRRTRPAIDSTSLKRVLSAFRHAPKK
jgi:hypothetical protein